MDWLSNLISISLLCCILSGCSVSQAYKQVEGDGDAIYRFRAVSSLEIRDTKSECSGRIKKLSSGSEARTQTVRVRCTDGRKGQLTMEVPQLGLFPENIEGSVAGKRVSFILSEADCVIWPKDFRCG